MSSYSIYFAADMRNVVRRGRHRCSRRHSRYACPSSRTGCPLSSCRTLNRQGIDFENVSDISEADLSRTRDALRADDGDVLFAMIGTIGESL